MTEHSQNFIISCGMIIQSFMLKRSTMCATWKNSQYPKTGGIVKLRYIKLANYHSPKLRQQNCIESSSYTEYNS